MRKLKRKLVLVFIAFLIILGIGGFISFFSIKNVLVTPSDISLSLDSSQIPLNLIFFPQERVNKYILNEYSTVREVKFKKIFPHTLSIELLMREPTAIVMTAQRSLAIDEEGVLFPYEGKEPLPIIDLPVEQIIPGDVVKGPGINTSLAFLKKLSHDEPIRRIYLSTDRTLTMEFKEYKVLLLADSDGAEQADTLQALLKGFRMKGSLPHVIDFRFSKPIITP